MSKDEQYQKLKTEFEDFVYIVSHDFKSVFRKMALLTEWIKDDLADGDIDEVNNHIDVIQNATRHMDGMLNGLTEISRIERIDENKTKLLLSEIIDEEFNNLNSDNKYTLKIHTALPSITAKPTTVTKPIAAILSNGLLFNANENKVIEVNYKEGTTKGTLTFSDNGWGIANKNLEAPFKLFYTEKFKTNIESSGWGLTYARKLLEHIGAEIKIIDSSEKGTSVTISLPIELLT